MAANNSAHFL